MNRNSSPRERAPKDWKVKILGAGSIGNHLAHAARSLGWDVVLCDVDPGALERTRRETYPGRYGRWDPEISLREVADAPRGGFDLVLVGTPPDSHLALALDAVRERPRAVLVEKPLCAPLAEEIAAAERLADEAGEAAVPLFVGYDHAIGAAARIAAERLADLGPLETLDVEFREHWGGIFAAHPWLGGPADSYLGSWRRGGGASGEHSHALHLWQLLAAVAGAGRVGEVSALYDPVRTAELDYDRLCLLSLRTESGLVGRVVQDVVTTPPRKWARAQGTRGWLEISIGAPPGADAVRWQCGDAAGESVLPKTRPDDFIEELTHVTAAIAEDAAGSPIAFESGLETVRVLAAARRSDAEKRVVEVARGAGARGRGAGRP